LSSVPPSVDHEARRAELAEAVWRVIRRDGLERASVRNVAQAAGLSTGSLRHFFASQWELLDFAMGLVTDRIRARIQALDRTGDAREVVDRILDELLPLDAERRTEAEVWLAFTARARHDADLRLARNRGDNELRKACRVVIELLVASGKTRPGLRLADEIERLYAVLDGLVLHAIVRPDRLTARRARTVLSRHLDELCAPD
jgi:AcrR family transcriptional regulator